MILAYRQTSDASASLATHLGRFEEAEAPPILTKGSPNVLS